MKYRILLVCTVLFLTGTFFVAAEGLGVEGSWTAYSPTGLPSYSLREHQSPESAVDLAEGSITFSGDGALQTDFLPYSAWEESGGFLVLSEGEMRAFFAVRSLNDNTLVLTNLTVIEQNRQIINIRVHRPESLLLLKQ